MSFSLHTDLLAARFVSAASCVVACLLAFVAASNVYAQQSAPLSNLPFPTSRNVPWDGEIMDNIVLRYRRVLSYPQAADRIVAMLNANACVVSPTVADGWRRQLELVEEVVHLSGTRKRIEKRAVTMELSQSCTEPVRILPVHTIDIQTPERRILYTSRGNERKVSVTEPPSEIVSALRSRAQGRIRDARNPRTAIGRSMGRVWAEQATYNGFACGSTVLGVENSCVLLEQPRHVATNTLISVRTKSVEDDPQCRNPAGPEWANLTFQLKCMTTFHSELVAFEKNARIPQDFFEMPAEARGLRVNPAGIPEADDDRERD